MFPFVVTDIMEDNVFQIPFQPSTLQRENVFSSTSVEARLIRAARARGRQQGCTGFNTCHLRRNVELLSQGGEVVGMAYMDHAF